MSQRIDAETGEIFALRTDEQSALAAFEQVIERGLQTFVEVGSALSSIRDHHLYRSYGTFEDYCQARWGFDSSRARQLILASVTAQHIESVTFVTLQNEGQVRALRRFAPEIQPAIARTAVARYGTPTASEIERVGRVFAEVTTTGHVDIGNGTGTPIEAALSIEDEEAVKRQQVYIETNGKHKPKMNHGGDIYTPQGMDACQTPPEGLAPLLPYMNRAWRVWEPAEGRGLLVNALRDAGIESIVGGDLLTGQNFFEYEPEHWDALITNPPYSVKYEWLARCYELGKPFALLMPVEMLGAKTAQALFRVYGIEVVFPNGRINFSMPNIGLEGSAAQFPTAWFCWRFDIGQGLSFSEMPR